MRDSDPDRLFSSWRCGYVVSRANRRLIFPTPASIFPQRRSRTIVGLQESGGVNRPDRGGRPAGVKSARRPPVRPRGAPSEPPNANAPL